MSLELEATKSRSPVKAASLLLLLWIFWVHLISLFFPSSWINLSMFSFLILFAAFRLDFAVSAFYLLLMSWLYMSVSIAPPGFLWASFFIAYGALRLLSVRFGIHRPFDLFGFIFVTSLFISMVQYFLLREMSEVMEWSWKIAGIWILSALIQGVLGTLSFPWFRKLLEER